MHFSLFRAFFRAEFVNMSALMSSYQLVANDLLFFGAVVRRHRLSVQKRVDKSLLPQVLLCFCVHGKGKCFEMHTQFVSLSAARATFEVKLKIFFPALRQKIFLLFSAFIGACGFLGLRRPSLSSDTSTGKHGGRTGEKQK
jgi:hypothetical protein